jgi:hypothetical protein
MIEATFKDHCMIAKRQAPNQLSKFNPRNPQRARSPVWLIGIVLLLALYSVAQPWLNRQFGWELPAFWVADSDSKRPDNPSSPSRSDKLSVPQDAGVEASEASRDATTTSTATSTATSAKNSAETFLEKIAEQTFRSPAGLLYKRGSEEGHRLKHLERHLRDIPERPGPHGVFRGSMAEFLQAIDDAYLRTMKKASGTSSSRDAGRTILEVQFPREIGFLGGQEGKRKSNPPLRKLKIVLDDDSVITAYPF